MWNQHNFNTVINWTQAHVLYNKWEWGNLVTVVQEKNQNNTSNITLAHSRIFMKTNWVDTSIDSHTWNTFTFFLVPFMFNMDHRHFIWMYGYFTKVCVTCMLNLINKHVFSAEYNMLNVDCLLNSETHLGYSYSVSNKQTMRLKHSSFMWNEFQSMKGNL